MQTRDELLKEAQNLLDGRHPRTDTEAALLALACIQLAQAQKTETRSLTVEDVGKVLRDELHPFRFGPDYVVPLGMCNEIARRIAARLRGGSHER